MVKKPLIGIYLEIKSLLWVQQRTYYNKRITMRMHWEMWKGFSEFNIIIIHREMPEKLSSYVRNVKPRSERDEWISHRERNDFFI